MPLQPGQILNHRYRIDRLLGQGGFGAVYLAWDLNLQAPVALKESLSASPLAEKQFRSEANLLFRLRHPNLPIVHDCFSTPGRVLYLTMDYIAGESLERKLVRQGRHAPLPVEQALAWILPICDALDYLHRQSPPVIHRDIKPANIIIRRDVPLGPDGAAEDAVVTGTPFLVDFGISKLFDPERKTTQGAQAFTPGYSPPEQYGSGATDARSDIYALGATLYHLLTGQAPPQAVDIMTGTEPPPWPPQALNPAVPPAAGQAVMRALQLDRAQRWSSAGDLKRALLEAAPPGVIAPAAPSGAAGPIIFPNAHAAPAGAPVGATPPATAPLAPGQAASANLVQVVPRPGRPAKRAETRKSGQTALLGALGGLVLLGVVAMALLLGWLAGRGTSPTPTAAALLAGGTQTPDAAALVSTAVAEGNTATALALNVAPGATASATPSPTSPPPSPTLTATATSTNIPPATASPGAGWVRPADGMTMLYIPAGEFKMGSNDKDPNAQDDEQPRRTVYLDPYWIDRTEVTNAMFRRFVAATGYVTQAEKQQNGQIFDPRRNAWRSAHAANWKQPAGDQSSIDGLEAYPVVLVSWDDALSYCHWAGGRLPTEAEWEKAARGTEGRIYPWGNDFKGDRLNFCDTNCLAEKSNENLDDGYDMRSPVGTYPGGASPYGVLDLSGNVWEWVLDWYQNRYTGLADTNPFGPQAGSDHVARGGSWADTYIETRAAYRTSYPPDTASDVLGFRCVR